MSQQTINVGASPNDGTGTPLRTAFQYTNSNFSELYTALGGGSGLPGATTQVIFNDGGTNLAGDAGLVYNKTTDALTIGGNVQAASATITGDLTVDTSTLKVDSANNRVGIGTLGAYGRLTIGVGSGLQAGTTTNAATSLYDIDYASTGDINTRLSFVNSNGVTNAAIDRIGNPYFNDNGTLSFLTKSGAGALTERYRIASDGVATWLNVGNIAGTAMTLNSTGLGIGVTPSQRLDILGSLATRAATTGSNQDVVSIRALNSDVTAYANALYYANTQKWHYNGASLGMTLDASGNLGVGVAAASNTRTHFKGSSTSTDNITYCVNSGDKLVFAARNDGLFITGSSADSATLPNSPYNLTSGSAANVYIDSQGIFYRSTSSLKYKTEIADSIRGLADVLKLRPVTYKAKNSGDTVFGGLIAEEVDAAGLTEFVQYAPDKTPDAIHYGNMVSLLVAAIKELTARVQTLEAK